MFSTNFFVVMSSNLWRIQGIWKQNPTFKYLRSWTAHLDPLWVITFWAIFLKISFKDLILILYIWVPNTTIEGTMNCFSNLSNTLLLLLGVWPKNLWFLYTRAFFPYWSMYLTMLAPYNIHCWTLLSLSQ